MSVREQIEKTYPPVLTARQAVEILNVSRKTLRKMVSAGAVTPVRFEGTATVRFQRDAVLRLVGG